MHVEDEERHGKGCEGCDDRQIALEERPEGKLRAVKERLRPRVGVDEGGQRVVAVQGAGVERATDQRGADVGLQLHERIDEVAGVGSAAAEGRHDEEGLALVDENGWYVRAEQCGEVRRAGEHDGKQHPGVNDGGHGEIADADAQNDAIQHSKERECDDSGGRLNGVAVEKRKREPCGGDCEQGGGPDQPVVPAREEPVQRAVCR